MGIHLNSKKFRALELSLVVAVAFAAPIFVAVYSLFSGSSTGGTREPGVFVFYGLIYELLAIAVMVYVLARQGRTLKEIGFFFSWKDLPVSLVLIVVSYLAFYICYVLVFYGYYYAGWPLTQPGETQTYLDAGLIFGTLLFILVNPFYEELIARAYVISEVKYLSGSTLMAVVISVGLQTSYHLYQGVPLAISLGALSAVLSIYYVKYKRIVPVILAHLYFDLIALLMYAFR